MSAERYQFFMTVKKIQNLTKLVFNYVYFFFLINFVMLFGLQKKVKRRPLMYIYFDKVFQANLFCSLCFCCTNRTMNFDTKVFA